MQKGETRKKKVSVLVSNCNDISHTMYTSLLIKFISFLDNLSQY